MELDELDIALLSALKDDCHQTCKQLAVQAKSNTNTVANRIKKLERSGYIKNYSAIIDYSKAGIGTKALVKVALEKQNSMDRSCFKDIISNPNVLLAYGMTGKADINIILCCRDIAELFECIGRIGKNRHIRAMSYEFIVRDYLGIDDFNPFRKQAMAKGKHSLLGNPLEKPLNQLDIGILSLLRHEANMPLRELSERLGAPLSTIKERIDRMEENRVIRRYCANLDFVKLGYWGFCLVSVKLAPERVNDPAVIEKIFNIPEVGSLFRVLGKSDLYAGIVAKEITDAKKVVKKICGFEGIQKAEIQVALAALKSGADYNPLREGEKI